MEYSEDFLNVSYDLFDNLIEIRDNVKDYSNIKKLIDKLFDYGWSYELSSYIIENIDFENLNETEFMDVFEGAYNRFDIKG